MEASVNGSRDLFASFCASVGRSVSLDSCAVLCFALVEVNILSILFRTPNLSDVSYQLRTTIDKCEAVRDGAIRPPPSYFKRIL